MQPVRIFIVEDEVMYAEMLGYYLSLNPDYEVEKFSTGGDCLKNLYKKPSVITLDYSLPDMNGAEVLKKIKEWNPQIPVIIISGQDDIGTAVKLLHEGAYDYIVKNDQTREHLWNAVRNLVEKIEMSNQIDALKQQLSAKYDFGNLIIGNSEPLQKVFSLIEKAARTNITVTVTGETGTGKELVAKAIHYNSARAKKPFVAVNVTAIPHELIESEMFGHEKGAFTGAASRRTGRFEEAAGGTLFLDEIGEMQLPMQAKLLRVLQEKEISRVGGNQVVKVDFSLIVATNRNLADEVKKGNFRDDLYYRLLGLSIHLPPLRERGNDIVLLAKHFIKNFCLENGMKPLSIDPQAVEKLMSYSWPGNVRELKAVTDLACVMASGGVITASEIVFHPSSKPENLIGEELTLKAYEKKIISFFLAKYDNNVLEVARRLDIGKSTIYRMLQQGEI